MLQSLRENMKGPTAKIVVGVAVAAMVLFGVESLFVNSVGGSEVATVNGEDISSDDLRRAIEQQKNRMRQQYQLEESNEMLSDERLRGPALMNLVRQKALQQEAAAAGMNVAPQVVKGELAKAFTQDGEFNAAALNNYISAYGYTPATLAQSEANAYVMRQLFSGVSQSEFITQVELNAMVAIAGQKRSFGSITIPRTLVESNVTVTDEEVESFYSGNAPRFTEPEKISLEYVELSISELAKSQSVTDEEIRQEYTREIEDFVSSTEYSVSHILLETTDSADPKVKQVADKLAAGETFADVAKAYSDDLGSKALGGELGLLVEGAFPKAFEDAAMALSEGQVSKPVKTDAGIHFIRLDSKKALEQPAFETRKEALAKLLKEQKASVIYLEKIQTLEEVSFGAPDLTAAASALGVSVKSTALFARGMGSGIAQLPEIAKAAFADDVYLNGQNSPVVEAGGDRALVIRLKAKQPAKLKSLAVVKAEITKQLTDEKVAAELEKLADDVVAKIQGGTAASSVAQALGYEFKSHADVERSSADVDFTVIREVFGLPRPIQGVPVTSVVNSANALTVIELNSVVNGDPDNLPEEQRAGMEQQLRNQLAAAAVEAYEDRVFEDAKYNIK